ncbi:hypothetical protein BC629DRAFT_710280 [Irpex lacteus]|nr:hypothetical protein BC629DRAFT_710280 [Irpex lacteus]
MSSATSEVRYTGKCLCGQIAYEVTGKPEFAGLCHCLNCKKWTGASTGWYVFLRKSTSASRKVKTPCAHSSTTPQTVEPPSTAVSVPAAGVRWLWVLPTTTIGLESSLGRWMTMSPVVEARIRGVLQGQAEVVAGSGDQAAHRLTICKG